jgi:dihydroorotase
VNQITLRTPDDFHVHLRDSDALGTTVPDITRYFSRALVMPNLKPPVVTVADALAYRERILAAQKNNRSFTPLMALYLTQETRVEDVQAAKDSQVISGYKWYPRAATTHSDAGISDIKALYPVLMMLQALQIPLLIHGESTQPNIDVFDREATFINTELRPLLNDFPQLRVVLEHITTQDAVDFIVQSSENVAATITVHHLLLNRNDLLLGGIKPHHYCLPVLKRQLHQHALIKAATSGHPRFFLGTDSAPHAIENKESACGCAGIYTAHAAIELYAEVFEQVGALDKLENFASRFGAEFYRLPLNQGTITLEKKSWRVPDELPFGLSRLVPMRAGSTMAWSVTSYET